MPFEEPKTVNPNKVLPMSPDRTVTYVPGLDHEETAPCGHGSVGNAERWERSSRGGVPGAHP
jgi:hypothetical protein